MKRNPLVVCLTNTVAANFTANGLLALGAKPAMVEEASEAAELTAHADALLVNLGTVTVAQAEAMRAAVKVATEKDVPWVLDPVGIQLLTFRRTLALELIKSNPTLIRGNHSEIDVLLGTVPTLTGTVPILSNGDCPHSFNGGNRPNHHHFRHARGVWRRTAFTGRHRHRLPPRRTLRRLARTGTDPRRGLSFRIQTHETGWRTGF